MNEHLNKPNRLGRTAGAGQPTVSPQDDRPTPAVRLAFVGEE